MVELCGMERAAFRGRPSGADLLNANQALSQLSCSPV